MVMLKGKAHSERFAPWEQKRPLAFTSVYHKAPIHHTATSYSHIPHLNTAQKFICVSLKTHQLHTPVVKYFYFY
jgi:hypothetical protein